MQGTMGTPYYMSPEQAIDFKHTDQRADIFSLGVVLYHLLCESFPFLNEYEFRQAVGVKEYLRRAASDSPTPLINHSQNFPDITPKLNEIVMRAVQHDPDDRYDLMIEFAEELLGYGRQLR